MLRKLILIFFNLVVVFLPLHSQNKLDSLKAVLKRDSPINEKTELCYNIATIYVNLEKHDSAIIYLNNALLYSNKTVGRKSNAKIFTQLGFVYKQLGVFEKALKYYFDALKIYETINDLKNSISLKISIGSLFNTIKQYQKALTYNQGVVKTLSLRQHIDPDNELLASAFNNLAITYQNTQQPNSALKYYQKSLAIKLKLHKHLSASFTLNNIGTLYSEKKEFALALDYFCRSLKLKRELGNYTGLINCYTNIGQLYLNKGELGSGIKYQDSAMYLLSKVNNPDLKAEVLRALFLTYEKKNDFSKAISYLKEYMKITDTIKSLAVTNKIEALQIIYEIEKKEKEIMLSKANINILEKELVIKNNKFIILSFASIGLTLLIILLIISFRFKEKNLKQGQALLLKEKQIKDFENEKFKKEIDHKNRELSLLTLQSLQKKELIFGLKEKLEIYKKEDKNNQVVQKLSYSINEILSFEDDWAVFKEHFEEINANFFNKLEAKAEGLTQSDLRHCAYIKIGLTTKEIARLLSITTESVQKSRVRLKKKLGLNRQQDLLSYIRNS